ncbi:NAD-dependent epimerase [Croceivirga radicis]|uniref:NAD-dependent epimerase n=1 Tax=Croceivirga radicis TaxID=1929488 RepID=A0A1V6LSC9_9FLAO|nr:NAD-dependent epimerase [Croceivirga radicis]OQD43072.1 NAD-dependent epimerase [Croceivirga radicis]
MKILVTGAAGFIGYHTSQRLILAGHQVVGLDNINNYYAPSLKLDRLAQLGINTKNLAYGKLETSNTHQDNFTFIKLNLEDREAVPALFEEFKFDVVCHLAAQAGVRYSLENPESYIDSNLVGFLTILEGCRKHNIKHLVYASSSSVYGMNTKIPFSTEDRTDHPVSLYAATKKSNELMAHTYTHLYKFSTTGLRFFTVYGPWGRPDMAIYLFTDAIAKNKPIKVFNHGKMERDFTYIDDIVEGVTRIVTTPKEQATHKVYNIGNNSAQQLGTFIQEIEKNMEKEAQKEWLPIQPGDVERTWADGSALEQDYNYKPDTSIQVGVKKFVDWFKAYYKL